MPFVNIGLAQAGRQLLHLVLEGKQIFTQKNSCFSVCFLDAAIASLLEGMSVGWLVGWLVGWSVGWSVFGLSVHGCVHNAFFKDFKIYWKSSFSVAPIASE